MATITKTYLVDDIDPTLPAHTTQTFTINNTKYTIDLHEKHAKAFQQALDLYVKHARKHPTRNTTGTQSKNIREWAAKNGYQLRSRGRIPHHVKNAYKKAKQNLN